MCVCVFFRVRLKCSIDFWLIGKLFSPNCILIVLLDVNIRAEKNCMFTTNWLMTPSRLRWKFISSLALIKHQIYIPFKFQSNTFDFVLNIKFYSVISTITVFAFLSFISLK